MMKNLMQRWQITSNFQLVIIFIVFAINGSLSAKIGSLILNFLSINKENVHMVFYYLILAVVVTLIYPFLIICIGFVFGQFDFFFKFSKQMLKKIGLGFIFK